ncbi:MAG TPA: lysophospholipid acyltransferase family protein [Rhodothermales bacterium]|nr:lysophospholipid acyltransferase family protein [Rhodothermales bacterium]
MLRWLVFRLVKLFYSRIVGRGREHVPVDRPAIFVANHPNGLLDPVLMMIGLRRPVWFLAKSTFFANPVGKWMMETFGALPVFRKRDEGKPGGPQGDARARNEQTFARSRALLRDNEALALFPEGTTHSDAQLRELRTGAARIALSAEDEAGWHLGLQIVPVGLWYEDKTTFRTSVVLAVGEPFTLNDYADAYADNEHAAVKALTQHIDDRLDTVVLQAENADLLAAMPVVAAWTLTDNGPRDLARQHAWAGTLLQAYQHLFHTDPERLEAIAVKARRYAALLEAVGITDPWHLELPEASRWGLLRRVLALIVMVPFALAGCLMSYGPYRLAGPVAEAAVRGDYTQTGTFKLIGGTLFVLIGWVVEAVVCGLVFGWMWGILLLMGAPLLGYISLRWGEAWHRLRNALSYQRLRGRRSRLVELLAEQRQDLTDDVRAAVASVSLEEGA